jgi:hypothetical protein
MRRGGGGSLVEVTGVPLLWWILSLSIGVVVFVGVVGHWCDGQTRDAAETTSGGERGESEERGGEKGNGVRMQDDVRMAVQLVGRNVSRPWEVQSRREEQIRQDRRTRSDGDRSAPGTTNQNVYQQRSGDLQG